MNICRCIISHDVLDKVTRQADKNELKKGLISSQLFLALCKADGKEMRADNIKNYLLALGIAVETTDELIFVPALVSDENKVNIVCSLFAEKNLLILLQIKTSAVPDCEVSVSFKKNVFPLGTYENFISHLMKKSLQKGKDIRVHETFYQKIGKINLDL